MSTIKLAVFAKKAIRNTATGVAVCSVVLVVAFFNISCGPATQSASAQSPSPQGLVLSGNLPDGVTHQAYNSVLTVSGGTAPYQFTVQSGTLPPGTQLDPNMGSISGTPVDTGNYPFQAGVTDAKGNSGSENFSITVDSKNGVHVTISPNSATLVSGQTQQFTANVTGTKNTGVTWTASAGSVDANGLYTAPNVKSQTNATVTATSKADPKKSASAAVTVDPANGQLAITSGNPPDGQVGSAYGFTFTASGGKQPYSWSVTSGKLPAGLALSGDGNLSGTPKATGSFSFTVRVTDAKSNSANGNYSITINGAGNYDGPAELPRVYLETSMSDTPAPGSLVHVAAGADVQAALDGAQCGDTIQLQAGASFAGPFKLPAKSCDDQHWIIVRTSAPDSALPPEGTRLTPCYAGVKSLPGRPQYSCNSPKNELAQIVSTAHAQALTLSAGANHYRLIGLELTRPAGTGWINTFVFADSTADRIIFDRMWIHGTAQDETTRGLFVAGITNIAVIDSYFNDFHCTSIAGTCTDAQAISGSDGPYQAGPLKVVDNFLEAAGEGIELGGAPSQTTISDVEVRHNHFFKPMTWMKGQQGFVGGKDNHPFIVKNHFELKNAVRVLFEGNILENTWGGFTQNGFSIVLTPRGKVVRQTKENKCPVCQVTDITIRYNTISHVGAGIQLGNVLSSGVQAVAGGRYSIHDITIDDLDSKKYTGSGTMLLVLNAWPKNVLNSITFNHVTGFPDAHLLTLMDDTTNPAMWGFTYTNNIAMAARYPVWSAGGGLTNCAKLDVPVTSINTCFSAYTFSHSAIVAPPQAYPPSKWPTGNFFPADPTAVQFVNYNNGNGGDYHLQASSPYKNAGTDGKDLGADIDAINSAIAGVN